ncbi:MAG TPA: hypothetical protein VF002_10415 [Gaiellaceae bacterium]
MAQPPLPLAGEIRAWPAARTRLSPAAERRRYGLVAVVWAGWLVAMLGVVVVGVETGLISDPASRWTHFGGPLWPLFTWDYAWYERVASVGYPHGADSPLYAFFPLWPWLLRASGSVADWIVAFGSVIAASALAFAGVTAAAPSARAWRSAAVLACWPGSFMLLLAYPDVIALAAAAWAAAFALRGRPWLAGLCGAVAAVARPTGFLIAIALLFVARGSRPARIFAAAAPVAAAAAVHAFFWERSGDPRAFLHAQALPIWNRNGPARFKHWPGHVAHALHAHALVVGVGGLVAAALVLLAARRLGRWHALVVAYLFVVSALLLGAQTTQTRIESALLAGVVPLLGLLWRLGVRYRPWALYATAVVAVSFFSGTVTSFARQALFAFPLYWAVANGPRQLRHPAVAALGVAANLAFALTIAKYAP